MVAAGLVPQSLARVGVSLLPPPLKSVTPELVGDWHDKGTDTGLPKPPPLKSVTGHKQDIQHRLTPRTLEQDYAARTYQVDQVEQKWAGRQS